MQNRAPRLKRKEKRLFVNTAHILYNTNQLNK
jgi:hypothetical protein